MTSLSPRAGDGDTGSIHSSVVARTAGDHAGVAEPCASVAARAAGGGVSDAAARSTGGGDGDGDGVSYQATAGGGGGGGNRICSPRTTLGGGVHLSVIPVVMI